MPANEDRPPTSALPSGEIRWEMPPRWGPALLPSGDLPLAKWLSGGQAQVVKRGMHRVVYRLDLPQGAFYLKHYLCSSWRKVGRNLLSQSASRRELRRAEEILRRDVPTATPVAIGEVLRGGSVRDSFLVTEAIPDSCTLLEYLADRLPKLPPERRREARLELIEQLARFVARLHRAGVRHSDFHAGNILVRDGAPGGPMGERPPPLYLIDLQGVRLSGPLLWRCSRFGVAMLASGLLWELNDQERRRLFLAYLAERPDLAIEPQQAVGEIEPLVLSYARSVLARRDQRCLQDNKDFYGRRLPGVRGHALRDVSPEELERLLRDPEGPLIEFRHFPLKLSHSSVVVRAELTAGQRKIAVAYKRCRVKSWWKWLLPRWLRPGRALLNWRRGHALLQRRITTPRPLLVIEPARGRDSYLATEWIEGGENLHLYLWRIASLPPSERRRAAVRCAKSLGALLGKMHFWHISHRDLKACNLMVADRGERTESYLIDLDGMSIRRSLSAAARFEDLARLAASMAMHAWLERGAFVAFLRAYAGELSASRDDRKVTWRAVSARARRLIGDMERRGKPVA
jgi:tRNA A-37 threonylcarbamoyl transferase component Bud32